MRIRNANTNSAYLSPKISPKVSEEFQKLKRSNDTNRLLRYIIFKLSDDFSEVEVESAEADNDWENFCQKLLNATSKGTTVWLTIYTTLFLKYINKGLGHCRERPPIRRIRLWLQG
jgi:hypothetical protein